MRCLSLYEPWASLMSLGVKRVETRSWSTSYRGKVAIHASKHFTREEKELCFEDGFYEPLHAAGLVEMEPEITHFRLQKGMFDVGMVGHFRLFFGAIIALGELVDVYRTEDVVFNPVGFRQSGKKILLKRDERHFGNYEDGRFAWVFENMVRLPQTIQLRGQPSLWTLDEDVVWMIGQQLQLDKTASLPT